jgi:hypothetical protein
VERYTGGTSAASSSTVNADAALGAFSITPAATTGFAAGDRIVIGPGTAREEPKAISKVSSGSLFFDEPLLFAHTAVQADTVRNQADIFDPYWIGGEANVNGVEVIVDYGAAGSGSNLQVEVIAEVVGDYITQ